MCKVNKILFSSVSIVDFEQVNVNCVRFQVQKTWNEHQALQG